MEDAAIILTTNHETEEHEVLLSSLRSLVQKQVDSLNSELLQSREDQELLREQNQLLEQQLNEQQSKNVEIERRMEKFVKEHNKMMSNATKEIDIFRQNMEDQLVEAENQVHQRVAVAVQNALQKSQKQHEEIVHSLRTSHEALALEHQKSLRTFDECKMKFQNDVSKLKAFYDTKMKTIAVQHENEIIELKKKHKNTLMEQSSSHHDAIHIQKKIHGTTMTVQQTALEAQIRAELTTANQTIVRVQEENERLQEDNKSYIKKLKLFENKINKCKNENTLNIKKLRQKCKKEMNTRNRNL